MFTTSSFVDRLRSSPFSPLDNLCTTYSTSVINHGFVQDLRLVQIRDGPWPERPKVVGSGVTKSMTSFTTPYALFADLGTRSPAPHNSGRTIRIGAVVSPTPRGH